MELRKLPYELTVCTVEGTESIDLSSDFLFIGKTEEEISIVCETSETPAATTEREDGWKGFVICGVLDFSLIGIFAISTYNTDYILVKAENFESAESSLVAAGYDVTS